MSTKNTVIALKPFVKRVSHKTADKAITDLARALTQALSEAECEPAQYLEDYTQDRIFDPACLLGNHEDIFQFVAPNYRELAQIMFEQRPIGLGTPNAMVGEGEFMALFCSPRVGISKKRNSGDLTVDGKTVELKGEQLRFFTAKKTTGKQVQEHARSIAERWGVLPNLSVGNRTAYEPWDSGTSVKLNKVAHWQQQFVKLGQARSQEFLAELCAVFMDCESSDFAACWQQGEFSVDCQQVLSCNAQSLGCLHTD
jgi:hypothetical protein